ncbi:ArsR/SmtB family transcription factor [Streptomyces sp. NPDC127190]|uniref:ArsR/SmtB family transcription factor n=1 Tax=unclassified Streptomyces TaxID=2593676 RepID=UPI003632A380
MIRINLGVHGLGGVRFAASPLDPAKDLLFGLRNAPERLGARWVSRAREALVQQRLGLLAIVGGGGPLGYAPDFLRPEPEGLDMTLDAALHQVARTPAERIRYELSAAVGGHSWGSGPACRPPRLLLRALEQGEDHLAERLTEEMARFWRSALAPSWPAVRARLEADVAARASAIALHGLAETLNHLAPNLEWRDGALVVHLRPGSRHRLALDAETAVLVPSAFTDRAVFCAAEPPGAPAPRNPLIIYPAAQADRLAPAGAHQLIGATRTTILAQLSQPRSSTEIAQRLYLSPATVSYHLQILHRAGLVSRTRHSRRVLYQRV